MSRAANEPWEEARFRTVDANPRLAWQKTITSGMACGFSIWVLAQQAGTANAAQVHTEFHAADNGSGGVTLSDDYQPVPKLGAAVGAWSVAIVLVDNQVQISVTGSGTVRWVLRIETLEV